jgi:heat-inducible transcriptional repressor
MAKKPLIHELNIRAQEILRHVVDVYVESGQPVGSKTLAQRLGSTLSAATIRNVMAELQEAGLLVSPHTSAGRVPTEAGLRVFVDGLLEIGDVEDIARKNIEQQCTPDGRDLNQVLGQASKILSGLSQCAAIVVAPKVEQALKHIEFVPLAPGQALVVLVSESGLVENRIIPVPTGLPASALREASNYLNAKIAGLTLSQAQAQILQELETRKAQLNTVSSQVVQQGLALWSGEDGESGGTLIVHGHANLLENVAQLEDIDRVRQLLESLELRKEWLGLLGQTEAADGVRIFIGSENDLFGLTGCSVVIAPFEDSNRVVGALGVIGPTRLNYGRVIPMVDYTAKMVSRLLS